jgi:inosose dehydratase
MSIESRIAGAPISWGVCEVPGWGHQMPRERVFEEMLAAGLTATEAGPEDFLPWADGDPVAFLSEHGLRLVGGFVPTVLHRDPERALAAVRAGAERYAAGGVVVLAAATGQDGYDGRPRLDEAEWATLCSTLDAATDIGDRYGATVVLHPHVGTMVETRPEVDRVLSDSRIPLCVDTGHLLIGGTDPVQLVREATDRVAHVHVKDVDAALAARVGAGELTYTEAVATGIYRPLGTGDIDFTAIVSRLEGHRYSGWYVLEQDLVLDAEPPEGEGPIGDVRRSRDHLIQATATAVAMKE